MWFGPGRIGRDYRSRHALLTLHIWFLSKRLVDEGGPECLAIQEELFERLWYDSRSRIREMGEQELMVNKHLQDTQQVTFQHLTHYDHAFTEFAKDDEKRAEEILGAIWVHLLLKSEDTSFDHMSRIAGYIESQYHNLVLRCPMEYILEGRIWWSPIPDFDRLQDGPGKTLKPRAVDPEDMLPKEWYKGLTEAGDPFWYNIDTNESRWEKPAYETSK